MLRILVAVLLATMMFVQQGFCVPQWNKNAPQSTDTKSIWPATSQANNGILDTLLSNYKRGFLMTYSSASTISVTPGEIVVSNALGTIRLFLAKATATNVTFSNLDTGASAPSTTYYVYAGTSTNTDAAPTFYVSLSSLAPSGITYYAQLGSFVTDSNSQITNIASNNQTGSFNQADSNKSLNVVYQALTDGTIIAQGRAATNDPATFYILSDSASSPVTNVARLYTTSGTTDENATLTYPVTKGNYWEVVSSGNQYISNVIWKPTSR